MDLIKKGDLENLIEYKKGWCVSLYMSAEKAGREKRQNAILFRKLVKKAEGELKEAGMPEKEIQAWMEPAHELLEDDFYWQYQSEGLAVFLAEELFLTYRLSERFEELAVVAKSFHLKPLLPLLSSGGHFFVLALSQNKVRLLRGTHYGIHTVRLDKMPKSLSEALRHDEPDKQLQFHTGARHRMEKREAMFHGHGAGMADKKEDLLHFFQKVDQGIREILADEEAPLVLASVDYYWPIFKEASSYPHIIDEGIKGNPEEIGDDELHVQAWNIVQPIFARKLNDSLNLFKKFEAEEQTSTDLKVILPAALQGRTAVLFVALGVHRWGRYMPGRNEIVLEKEGRPANRDLLDLAAVQTLLNEGRVFALAPEKMPVPTPIAAIFRY
jgi:hypothetical protein